MLYKVLAFDNATGLGRGIEAARENGVASLDPSGSMAVTIASRRPLQEGEVYSFNLKNFFYGDEYIRAELDYKSPHPISWRK